MDDLDYTALACDGTTPPRGDVQEPLILGGGESPRRGHAGKDAISFGHVAPDEAGVSRRQRRQNLGDRAVCRSLNAQPIPLYVLAGLSHLTFYGRVCVE